MTDLKNKTVLITGASRGIGFATALRLAKAGANVALLAKTTSPHRYLPGTIFSAADEIRATGANALPIPTDVRSEDAVRAAVEQTVETFGGIDICINNASAINHCKVEDTEMKSFDLMHQVNGRGTFLVSKECLPYLKKSESPHILNLCPTPILTGPALSGKIAYMMAKYGMSMCVVGMAEEFRPYGIAVNGLQPRTWIATSAIKFRHTDEHMQRCRKPDIMADAAFAIVTKPPHEFTGNFCTDDTVLYESGVRDFDKYRVDPAEELLISVKDEANPPPPGVKFEAAQ